MPTDARQIVFFSETAEPQIKVVTGLRSTIGGASLAQRLFNDFKETSLAVGPLTGAFPATGVAFVANLDGLWQLGADFTLIMRLAGLDGAVGVGLTLEDLLPRLLKFINLREEQPLPIAVPEDYEALYKQILERVANLWVQKVQPLANCPTCPLACGKKLTRLPKIDLASQVGACGSAASIYNDKALSFAALQALGYDYTHEELEAHEENSRR